MRKIFTRMFLAVILLCLTVVVVVNFLIQTIYSHRGAEKDGRGIIGEISRKVRDNDAVIADLRQSLDENYLTRARVFAEMIKNNPAIVYDIRYLQRLAAILNVDELHITDENGVLIAGNEARYAGFDFRETDQTIPFLPALTDKSFEFAQDPQPNGSEGILLQYIGVARQDKPGVVQVGVSPAVLERALRNNKIDVILAAFFLDEGKELFAVDRKTGRIAFHQNTKLLGLRCEEAGMPDLRYDYNPVYKKFPMDGKKQFTVLGLVSGASAEYVVGVGYSPEILYRSRTDQGRLTIIINIFLGLALILYANYIVKRVVIDNIDTVNVHLEKITGGKFDVLLNVRSCPEFTQLSAGINAMAKSLGCQFAEIENQKESLKNQNETILQSINYAAKIQKNLLPSDSLFGKFFADYSIIWKPRDIVGGDVYWIKSFRAGTVLCVCDCTGHGTPGALLTMLVVSALEAAVTEQNCSNPAEVIFELEKRLTSFLGSEGVADGGERKKLTDFQDGCDIAVVYTDKNGGVTLACAGLPVFVCDGREVKKIRGQPFHIGEGKLRDSADIALVKPDNAANCAFYIASDGLFDQIGGQQRRPFGYATFMHLVLKHHQESQQFVSRKIWEAFEAHALGEEQRDDVELISFKP